MNKNNPFSQFVFFSVMAHGVAIGGLSNVLYEPAQIDFANDAPAISLSISHIASEETTLTEKVIEKAIQPEPLPELPKPKQNNPIPKRVVPQPIAKQPTPQETKAVKPIIKKQPPQKISSNLQGGLGSERSSAQIIRAPKPPYPFRARKAGFEGQVLLHVAIAASGKVENVSVLEPSGRTDCDQSAVKTISEKWRFEPATFLNRPVKSNQNVAIVYNLE